MSYQESPRAKSLSDASRAITPNMTVKQAAIAYANAGVAIFPIHSVRPGEDGGFVCSCGKADCSQVGKHPYIGNWRETASSNPHVIDGWWRRYPDANIGYPIPRGILVVDVDNHKKKRPGREEPANGWDSFADVQLFQYNVMETLSVTTGGGGLHCFLVDEEGRELKSRNGAWPGIDLRAEGTYVILPPSTHQSGKLYEWSVTSGLHFLESQLHEYLTTRVRKDLNISEDGVIPEGRRNDTLFRIASRHRGMGYGSDAIIDILKRINHERCDPPLPEEEVVGIGVAVSHFAPTEDYADMGNARRLEAYLNGDAAWNSGMGWVRWWEGQRYWQAVEDIVMHDYVEQLTKIMHKEADEMVDDVQGKLHRSHASRLRNHAKAKSAVLELRRMVATPASRFETSPMLLNVLNGTINLQTGELNSHNREDHLMQRLSIPYTPDTPCQEWLTALAVWFKGDKDVIRVVQKLVGYFLTGSVEEHRMPILYGPGGNGKSTFMTILNLLLGPYAMTLDTEVLMKGSKSSNPDAEVARLFGKRLALCSESAQFARLHEDRVKGLTGGDRIRARELYHKAMEFEPTHKIILGTNHKPIITDRTESIWRRVLLIPFDAVIPRDARDPKLGGRLRKELEGILSWAVKGCLMWQADGGFEGADEIDAANLSWRAQMDTTQQFIDDELVNDGSNSPVKDVYARYKDWCRQSGIRTTLGRTNFVDDLKEHSINTRRGTGHVLILDGWSLRGFKIDTSTEES